MRKLLIGNIAIGIMQIVDACILYSNNGSFANDISHLLSGIEFLWAIVSLIVAIRVKYQPVRKLAIAFFAYNVVGWLIGVILMMNGASPLVNISLVFVIFGGLFGIYFAVSSYLTLMKINTN